MSGTLTAVRELLREHYGLAFAGRNEARLVRALDARRAAWQAQGRRFALDGYPERLRQDPAERQALVEQLMIHETYFFREPEQLRLLTERLIPRLLAARGQGRPLRILSAGCASGEEPYSLAIALWEDHGERTPGLFQIIGADLDRAVLEDARAARFGPFSFRAMPETLRQRYFTREGGVERLRAEVRRLVDFRVLNLLAPHWPADWGQFDLILCRNVSIYLDMEARQRLQRALAERLHVHGVLVVGVAEILANDFGILSLAEEAGVFYFHRALPSPGTASAPAARDREPSLAEPHLVADDDQRAHPWERLLAATDAEATLVAAASRAQEIHADPWPRIREALAEQRPLEARLLLEQRLATAPTDAAACLLLGFLDLERGAFAAAASAANRVLERDDWSVDALLLAGLSAKWSGDPPGAIDWLRRAVYAWPDCWPAHYHLGDLYRDTGQWDLARQSWQRVLRLTATTHPVDHGLRILPLDLPPGKVRFLCQHYLTQSHPPPSAPPDPAPAGSAADPDRPERRRVDRASPG